MMLIDQVLDKEIITAPKILLIYNILIIMILIIILSKTNQIINFMISTEFFLKIKKIVIKN
jgi:hypothetical protein